MKKKNIKVNLNSLLIRQKVDWCSLIVAQPLTPSQAQDIFDHFECQPELQKGIKFFRDAKNKIAAFFQKTFFKIEFEGQYFQNETSFHNFQFKVKSWNDSCPPPLRLKITRIDLASDFVNLTPLDILPLAIRNSNAQPHFSCKQLTYTDSKTKETETIYYLNRDFTLRAYRKDIEMKSKSKGGLLDSDDRKTGFFDLPEYADKVISRLELVLKSEDSSLANDLINSNLDLNENSFVKECLKHWAQNRTIRHITKDNTKSRRPLHFVSEFMRGDLVKIKVDEANFNKVRTPKQKTIDRSFKTILNAAAKKGISPDELAKEAETYLEHYKAHIFKPAA